jgi:UvrD-like helicase C-terminal domain/AAA domain
MRAFFEGPAGSGKTHRLIERAEQLVSDGFLEGGQYALALTFMNGARRRLSSKLAAVPTFRRQFRCLTFDSFAQMIVARRRALLRQMPDAVKEARSMNEFDATCFLASRLLAHPGIAEWIAVAHPIAIVDEAQDLAVHRFAMLRALDTKCQMLAAADGFQCLDQNHIAAVDGVLTWLRGADELVELSEVVRTSQSGILQVARAIREGRSVLDQLGAPTGSIGEARVAAGFRLREVPASNAGIIAWAIGFELMKMAGGIAILTPDSRYSLLRAALEKVRTEKFNLNKAKGMTFGPFHRLEWETGDEERASTIIDKLNLAETMSFTDAMSALAVCAGDIEIIETTKRLARRRRIAGLQTVSCSELEGLIRAAARDISRHGRAHSSSIEAMTIHAAKNREFQNVLVLWPHTAPADPDQARRLLYNAITRAQRRCSVIVFGKDRLGSPPFSM